MLPKKRKRMLTSIIKNPPMVFVLPIRITIQIIVIAAVARIKIYRINKMISKKGLKLKKISRFKQINKVLMI